ncbi:MAG: glycosyltransferase family 9 protein [Victivallales bacterium]|nr:glycosyltransferase family 9 protein [Victivallales bacterium]
MSHFPAIVKLLAWMKLLVLKILVWKFSILWPWRRRLKRVLIIEPFHLGDILTLLSPIQNLCDYYHDRGYEISILIPPAAQPLVEACPLFDHALGYHILRGDFTFKKKYELYCKLYNDRYEVVVNPFFSPDKIFSFISTIAVLCRPAFSCAMINNTVVPMQMTPLEQYLYMDRWRKRYTTFLEDHSRSFFKYIHDLCENVCGMSFPLTLYSRGFGELPKMSLPSAYYVIVPGAGTRRPWPMKRMAELITRIHQRWPELMPVLTGGKSEQKLGDEIRQQLPDGLQVIDMIGRSTLLELTAIVKGARFVVSNDTGTAHLAPLFNTKSVVISGAWHIGWFHPNPLYVNTRCILHPKDCAGCGWTPCPYATDGIDLCIAEITVDEVMAEIERSEIRNP